MLSALLMCNMSALEQDNFRLTWEKGKWYAEIMSSFFLLNESFMETFWQINNYSIHFQSHSLTFNPTLKHVIILINNKETIVLHSKQNPKKSPGKYFK